MINREIRILALATEVAMVYYILSLGKEATDMRDIARHIWLREAKSLPEGNAYAFHPDHYRPRPVECVDVQEHFNFCLGNTFK